MLKTGVLQILALFCALISCSVVAQPTCSDELLNCKCNISSDSVIIDCFYDEEKENVYNIEIRSTGDIKISCNNLKYPWSNFLNGKTLNHTYSIKNVTIEKCLPLSAQDYPFIRKILGLKGNIENLTYISLIRTLKCSDFDYLTDLRSLELHDTTLDVVDVDCKLRLQYLTTFTISQSYIKFPMGFFKYAKKLQSLNIISSIINRFNQDIFDDLESIHEIVLYASTIINYEQYDNIFRNLSTLRKLTWVFFKADKLDVFMDLTELQELQLSSPETFILPKDIFRHNKKLTSLYMNFNQIKKLPNGLLANLPVLAVVDVSSNELNSLPEDLLSNSTSLKSIDLSCNSLTVLPTFLLKHAIHLEYLNLTKNKLKNIPEGFFLNTTKLKKLYLSFNNLEYINRTIFNSLRNLKELHLDNNKLSFIHRDAFATNKKLNYINFEKNHLTIHTDNFDIYGRFLSLQHNVNLSEINLASNNISELFSDWLRFPNLKRFNLRNNSISKLKPKDLQFVAKGLVINLESNKVKTVYLKELERLAIEHNRTSNGQYKVKVLLHHNPFECDCDSYNLLRYVKHEMKPEVYTYVLFELSYALCSGPAHMKGIGLVKLRQTDICPTQSQSILYIVIGCSSIFLLGIIFSIVYFYYKLLNKIEHEVDENKVYDAFISYSYMDEEFVQSVLLAKLEAKPYLYSICIHERDWIAGEWIQVQIQRSIDESKRTIIVLSKDFLNSLWGKIEFQLAHKQALEENRHRVIIILLDDIEEKIDLMNRDFAEYLKTHTYIKWGDPFFWQKLIRALPYRK